MKFSSTGVHQLQIGSFGSGNGGLFAPEGVALDGSGSVFVTDVFNDLVQKFTPAGDFQSQFGMAGLNPGEFNGLRSIALDAGGNIFVTDVSGVQKFSPTGVFIHQWVDEDLDLPGGLAFTPAGDLLVTSEPAHVLLIDNPGIGPSTSAPTQPPNTTPPPAQSKCKKKGKKRAAAAKKKKKKKCKKKKKKR